jgi:hypothetical protein
MIFHIPDQIVKDYEATIPLIKEETKENNDTETKNLNESKQSQKSQKSNRSTQLNKSQETKNKSVIFEETVFLIQHTGDQEEEESLNLVEQYLKICTEKVKHSLLLDNMEEFDAFQTEKLIDKFIEDLSTKLTSLPNHNIQEFDRVFLENYPLFLANIIISFTGLLCSFYFDGDNFLYIEFYGNSEIFRKLAVDNSYSLQLKIMSNYKICNLSKNTVKDNNQEFMTRIFDDTKGEYKEVRDINEKNKVPFECINEEDISLFPPFMKYDPRKEHFFRRYTNIDEYHMCEDTLIKGGNANEGGEGDKIDCTKLIPPKTPLTVNWNLLVNNTAKCTKGCDIFRNIDKIRLLHHSLNSVINIDSIKTFKFFHKFLTLRQNNEVEQKFDENRFIYNYLNPITNSSGETKINHFIRDFYGEKMGFYFLFLSHYLYWLIIPSIVGAIYYLIPLFISIFRTPPYNTYLDLFMTCVIILWGCLFFKSWSSKEKFYNYVWGMTEYAHEVNNCIETKVRKVLVFQGVRIPITNKTLALIKKVITIVISISMVLLTIAINTFLFYISTVKAYSEGEDSKLHLDKDIVKNMKDALTNNQKHEVKSYFWYYGIPIISVVLRNILSTLNYAIASWSCKFESHTLLEKYEDSYILKVTVFEFVNYYFYLFYIGYFKHLYGNCTNNDCFGELGHQLVIILITSNIINVFEIGIPFISNLFRVGLYEYFPNYKNSIFKNFFTKNGPRLIAKQRSQYEDPIAFEYLEVIFNYGYVILFGVTSPICFIIAFIHIYIERLVDCYKLIKLHTVNDYQGTHGIGIILRILKIFTFLGIITNSTLAFFALDISGNSSYKWPVLFTVENFLIFAFLSLKYNKAPVWFDYLDQIKYNCMRKVLVDHSHQKKPLGVGEKSILGLNL